MLRLDAERFGTAEYYEATQDGERPRARRRLAWYGIGVALAIAILYVHPTPAADAVPGLGQPARGRPRRARLRLAGVGIAVAFATLRYHRIRFPDAASYPGALLNSLATAFIDEVAFRGALFGLLLVDRPRPDASRTSSRRCVYALTTRLGAPGSRPLPAGPRPGIGPRRRLADGHRRAGSPRRSSATRSPASRSSCAPATPARRSRAAARSRRSRSAAAPPEGWRVIGRGSRRHGARDRASAGPRAPAAAAAGRAVRPHPVLRLALPVLRLRGLRRRRGPRPDARIEAFLRRSDVELDLRADALERGGPGAGRPPLETLYLGGGTPSLLPAEALAAAARRSSATRFGLAAGRRGHPRGQSRARRARRPAALGARPGVTRLSLGAQSMDDGELRAPRPAPSAARRRRRRRRGARGRHRIGQPRPALRRARRARSATWIDDARRGARARARTTSRSTP